MISSRISCENVSLVQKIAQEIRDEIMFEQGFKGY